MPPEDIEEPVRLLGDVRVVDLTDGYGAFASRLLADLGAEVVRIEPPDGGRGRHRGPLAGDGTSLHHVHRNAGKDLVVVDTAEAAGVAVVDGLLAGTDIVFVSHDTLAVAPDFTAAALAARHPHAVVVSITPFGLEGPAAGWVATELVAQAAAGVVYRSGVPELPPVAAPGSFCEDGGAAHAALAALLALRHVRAGGRGQLIDVSSVLALAQCTEMALPLWGMLRSDQVRSGAGLYPLYECRDGLARIVLPMAPSEWRSLIAWLGSPPEWKGPAWEQPIIGPDERALVTARLPERFAAGTRAELAASGDAAGVRVTPVLTPVEVLTNEHTAARGTFRHVPVTASGDTGALAAGLFGVRRRRAGNARPAVVRDRVPEWEPRARPLDVAGPTLPLVGIRVLEIGSGVAAPEGARVLASWGADVIKIEAGARPDFQRRVFGTDMNPAFSTIARDKRALAVDLSTDAGRALVRRLLPHIDVIVENNATGVIDRLGLGWDEARTVNPRIVSVGTQLYGDRGPWAERKGYGPSARAVGGLTWLWAHGPDAPRGVMTIHPDHLAGRLVAMGAVAGLLDRDTTGEGCRVDLAQAETVSMLLGDLLMAESLSPGAAQPTGNDAPDHAPAGLFRCADDEGSESWLALSVTDDDLWQRLLAVAPTALDRPEWRTMSGRLAQRAQLDAAIASWVADADASAMESELQHHGIAASRALHPRLHVTHPHFVARGFVVEVDQPGSGTLLLEGPCFTAPELGTPRNGPAPLPGQHTAEILRELLGIDDAGLRELVAQGAIDEPLAQRAS